MLEDTRRPKLTVMVVPDAGASVAQMPRRRRPQAARPKPLDLWSPRLTLGRR
ncbi:hypothetical protein [Nitratidesulfovibrio vulgaris]|uniref:hypothetical protein n=1 Tax=Nitratidesulfovibrio vulgaris TaxID=881 RepID=UPI0013E8A88F|nr:hypothetical protein [Nitratidesulfovibrio vulgaris]